MEQGKGIYRFCENEFIEETPEWNDGILYINDEEHEVSIRELKEKIEKNEKK